MQEKMYQQQNQEQSTTEHFSQNKRADGNTQVGDYIDFEEIK